MPIVERNALVGHSADELYSLVANVEAYPAFLPWCAAAEVLSRDGPQIVAALHIRYRGVPQRFTTRNTLTAGSRIEMSLVDGPFRRLDGAWRFLPLGSRACRVDLTLTYELGGAWLSRMAGPTLDTITDTLIDAFVRRADTMHGSE